ncbi:PilZ domain-containing protein [Granulicella pectinivorans]|jgi:hypothetical protein|uniref:PilZ domain-containing protein n=1 Tax=Granulicella pectinivorans TaxID=474950 RepID=A0A1I6MY54_9BACT|nr:PilZ domain-containing protein [Granulicella pectinivorans]SFS20646.1 PilZ domain-containing protein [Granulicella pectinivorans]
MFKPGGGPTARDWQKLTSDTPVRSAVRFPIRMAIRLQTEHGEVDAVTEDVSANGLLFTGRHLPDANSRIEFTMTMPGAIMGHSKDTVIHCTGRIVRHQKRVTDEIAAAVIDEYFLTA